MNFVEKIKKTILLRFGAKEFVRKRVRQPGVNCKLYYAMRAILKDKATISECEFTMAYNGTAFPNKTSFLCGEIPLAIRKTSEGAFFKKPGGRWVFNISHNCERYGG